MCLDGMLPGETQDAKGNGAGDSVNAALPSESAMEQNIQPLEKSTGLSALPSRWGGKPEVPMTCAY